MKMFFVSYVDLTAITIKRSKISAALTFTCVGDRITLFHIMKLLLILKHFLLQRHLQ